MAKEADGSRDSPLTLFIGTVVDAPTLGTLRLRPSRVLAVDSTGVIVADLEHPAAEPKDDVNPPALQARLREAKAANRVVTLTSRQFLMPGLVDCHIHAPQYSYAGTGLDLPLMGPEGWLEQYTFPAERRLNQDLSRARLQCLAVVRSTLRHGTTTALYFNTLHLEPTKILADVADLLGQRALVGKVCMDRNSPENYSTSALQNIADTEALIEHCKEKRSNRIDAVVTPRFVPTCSVELLEGLGRVATKHNCRVQSHVAESVDEVEFCKALHPDTPRDAQLLEKCGLLPRSVLAHGVHLSDEEFKLLRNQGAAVAHCPLSNAYFAGSIFRTRTALEAGVKVGLGTDVAGGYDPSMLSAMRAAVWASRILESGAAEFAFGDTTVTEAVPEQPDSGLPRKYPGAKLSIPEALWLGTMGGAASLGLDEKVGSLEAGKEFDALIVDLCSEDSRLDIFPEDTELTAFEKFFHNGDDRNIVSVYVQGQCVLKRSPAGDVLQWLGDASAQDPVDPDAKRARFG